METLHEVRGLPRFDLPRELLEAYGGGFGLHRQRVVANFVSTIDGVVAIPELPQSNKLISDGNASDRLVMGLLRAAADAVLIGSGTLRASANGLWTAEKAYRPAAAAFAELRRRLDLPPVPARVVLTGTGSVPAWHPLFADGALVLTTDLGASRLDGRLPSATTVVSLGDSAAVDLRAAIEALRARGHELILSEAGPRAFASLVEAGLIDELFLTVSPLVAGRGPSNGRLGLVEGFEALPGERRGARLLSVRRDGAHLFLRYELGTPPEPNAVSSYSP
jgi:riboflavin biosynthesis pyrimidine reductase